MARPGRGWRGQAGAPAQTAGAGDKLGKAGSMHKLKSSQKDEVHQLMAFTQAGERTAIWRSAQSEWKLDAPRTASSRTRPRSTRTPCEPPWTGRRWSRCITGTKVCRGRSAGLSQEVCGNLCPMSPQRQVLSDTGA
ncbi:DCN1-like protein 2 [Monodon monoceros]|uniref:DCN1-like protein 2 n=1 Tax=Monodon monoceros TaxID=40151 RepID=UPI0010F5F9E0|nr:DCN1-like protein 2 [Monodon monoceros]